MGRALKQARSDMTKMEKKYGRKAIKKNSPYHQKDGWAQPVIKLIRKLKGRIYK